jgi:hypothetical protein
MKYLSEECVSGSGIEIAAQNASHIDGVLNIVMK